MADDDSSLIWVPGDGTESRTFTISAKTMVWLRRGAWTLGVGTVVFLGTWVWFGARALRVSTLEARVTELEAEREQFEALARTLEAMETRYDQIRSLFGPGGDGVESEVWLPPPAGVRNRDSADDDDPTPSAWPLTERGFVTQPLLEGVDAAGHPGLDIAVPADSYIRAAGAGTVEEAGEDPVYGRYIVLDHGNGYRTRYAHANLLLVAEGASVRRREIIALSGSTGRSTAPHLHFEVLLDGEAVDPLTLVRPPA